MTTVKVQSDLGDEMFFTVTMAEILEGQGRMDDALAVYMYISKDRPKDERIASSINRLMKLAG